MKTCVVGVELFHADVQTDRQTDRHDEAKSRFSKLCKLTYKQEVARDLEMGRGW